MQCLNKHLKRNGALIGPFKRNTFLQTCLYIHEMQCLNKHFEDSRVNLDLSSVTKCAVNDYLPQDSYFGVPVSLVLPKIDDLQQIKSNQINIYLLSEIIYNTINISYV